MSDDTQTTEPIDPAADWALGSSLQLPRLLGAHCISCAHFAPTKGAKGTCDAIPAASSNKLIAVPAGEVVVDAAFGCLLHAEIVPALFSPPTDKEKPAAFEADEALLAARTDLALGLGLLPGPPDDFAGGGPGIERERARRDARRNPAEE